jgi:hypothetical protein
MGIAQNQRDQKPGGGFGPWLRRQNPSLERP